MLVFQPQPISRHTLVTSPHRIELATEIGPTNTDAYIVADDVAERDRDWVARICTGDAAAFEAVFREYKNDLGALVESHVRSRAVTEEILQELFLHLWEQRYDWHFAGPLNAYLFRAARNRAISYLRHERVESRFRERLFHEQRNDIPGVPTPSVGELLDAQDLESAIERAVNCLPDRCREVFVLNRYHHRSYAEVAGMMGISVKTVEVQMGRALAALRQRLAPWRK